MSSIWINISLSLVSTIAMAGNESFSVSQDSDFKISVQLDKNGNFELKSSLGNAIHLTKEQMQILLTLNTSEKPNFPGSVQCMKAKGG